jgi:hypothetical protein
MTIRSSAWMEVFGFMIEDKVVMSRNIKVVYIVEPFVYQDTAVVAGEFTMTVTFANTGNML